LRFSLVSHKGQHYLEDSYQIPDFLDDLRGEGEYNPLAFEIAKALRTLDQEKIYFDEKEFSEDISYALSNAGIAPDKFILRVSYYDLIRLKKYSLETNDMVFSRVGSVDRCVIVRDCEDGWLFSGRCLRVRVNNSNLNFARYLNYFFSASGFRENMLLNAVGVTMPSINTTILSNISVLQPSLNEQIAITSYLDHEKTVIDSLIADKQNLITLLKEKCQVIISEVVTKGLDKNAKMKDSGIEWIGEIPEGWKIKKFGYLFSFGRGLECFNSIMFTSFLFDF